MRGIIARIVTLVVVITTTLLSIPAAAEAASYEPGAPTNVTASSGNGTVTVSWTPPTYTGGYPILSYWVRSSPGYSDCNARGGATSCTVTGLTNGVTYTFTVQAYNNITYGASGTSNPVTPCCSVPGAPTGVFATASSGQASVRWSPPSSTGGAVSRYIVTAYPGGGRCETDGGTSCTVTGLTNGTSYTFSVTAGNSAGTGPPSTSSSPVTPIGVPSEPIAVVATANERGALTVSWSPPSSNGGATVTAYAAVASPGNLNCQASSTTCTITGLADATEYSVTVTAANQAGSSKPSAPTTPVRTFAVPGAPTSVQAYLNKGTATVTWTGPEATGGAVVNQYTVVSEPGGLTCTSPGSLSCVVRGLSNGQTYTFTVTAYNVVGPGPASAASTPAKLVAGPSAPTRVVARRIGSTATITWKAPKSAGGLKISRYVVTASSGGGTCRTAKQACAIRGLRAGVSYSFRVQAFNAKGAGVPAESNRITVPAPASPPSSSSSSSSAPPDKKPQAVS